MNVLIRHLTHQTRNKSLYLSLGFALLLLLMVMFLLNPLVSVLDQSNIRGTKAEVSEALNEEMNHLVKNTRELARSENIILYLEEAKDTELLAYTLTEKDSRALGGILVTDRYGVVISRTINPLIHGDLIFESTRWGQEVKNGKEVASIEAGITVPLVMIAGAPIMRGDESIGAIFAAHNLTYEYARQFRDRYLPALSEIAFVDKTSGLTGASFDSSKALEVLESHLATLLPLENGSGITLPWHKRVKLDGQEYVVSALPLQGLDGITSYMLVFTPSPVVTYAAFLVAIIVLIFLFIELNLHKQFPAITKRHIVMVALSSGGLFIVSLFILSSLFENTITRLLPLPQIIYNSIIGLEPESMIFGESFEHRVAIKVVTGGEVVNAVEADLHYDPDKAAVVEIITEKSICPKEFFFEKEIIQNDGTVKISCIIPREGFIGQGILAELIVKPKGTGTFEIKFGEGTKVLAHDGLGTNVLRYKTDGSYQSVSLDSLLNGEAPFILHSPTHPNQARWYSSRSPRFVWSSHKDIKFKYYLDQNMPLSSPTIPETVDVDANSLDLRVREDGVHYFHLLNASTTYIYKLKIDATPPDAPIIKASETEVALGDVVRFELSSADRGSGLQTTFYFQIDGGLLLPVHRELSVPFYEKGSHTITVRAFDLANNSSESSLIVRVR